MIPFLCYLLLAFIYLMDMMLELKDISIHSWNIRGANNARAKCHMKGLLRRLHPTFLLIMETHIQFGRTGVFWYQVGYSPVSIIEAQGQEGGLWVLMQNGVNFTVTVLNVCAHVVTFSISLGAKSWTCTGLYASPIPVNRQIFWQHLCNLGLNINSPWLLLWDFNETLPPGDLRGGLFSISRAEAFANVLDHCGLVDLDTVGGRFTWHRIF